MKGKSDFGKGRQHCGAQNAKDACHNSLLGADCSVVNPSGGCGGTSSYPQGKPQTGHGQ
jgi:hypothetical protein